MPQIPDAASDYAMRRLAAQEKSRQTGLPMEYFLNASKPGANAPAEVNKDGHSVEDDSSVTFFPPKPEDEEDEEGVEEEGAEEELEREEYSDHQYGTGERPTEEGSEDVTPIPPAAEESESSSSAPTETKEPQHPYGQWTRVSKPAPVETSENLGKKAAAAEGDDDEGGEDDEVSARDFKFVEKQASSLDDADVPLPAVLGDKRPAETKTGAPAVQFKKRKMEGKGNLRQRQQKLDIE